MSNSQLSNDWLSSGHGPGSPERPGFTRFDARNALIKHHNFRGEAVFLASRRWHHSRAQNQAARMRLDKAMREVEDAEMQELQALHSMGIGTRNYSSFVGSQPKAATSRKAGGPREALEKRMAAEAAADMPGERKFQVGSRARSPPLARPGVDDGPTKSAANDARSAWLAKMQGSGAALADPPQVAVIETKKPRRSAKASTTRD